jgi:hypothetical protein
MFQTTTIWNLSTKAQLPYLRGLRVERLGGEVDGRS